MDIDTKLAAIVETQNEILRLLNKRAPPAPKAMTLKEAAEYTGYSTDHFRRLAVEHRIIPFSRPSGQQKGKLIFQKADLDTFLNSSRKEEKTARRVTKKRKSKYYLFE